MLSQLKNNLNSKNLLFKDKETHLINFEPTLTLKHPSKKQSRPFNHNVLSSISPISSTTRHTKQRQSSSLNKQRSNFAKKPSRQSTHQPQQQTKSSNQVVLDSPDIIRILQQSQKLINASSLIQGMNLLKAIRQPSMKINNKKLSTIIAWNLGVTYYQAGFLEEAHDEFIEVMRMLQESFKQQSGPYATIQTKMLQAKIQLQICILFSQLGSHEDALNHARKSSKMNYSIAYQLMNTLCNQGLFNFGKVSLQSYSDELRELTSKQINVCNNIMVMQHLHRLISDLGGVFGIQSRVSSMKELFRQFKAVSSTYLSSDTKIDMDMLYNFSHLSSSSLLSQNNNSSDTLLDQPTILSQSLIGKQIKWIYESKILDRIQLKPLSSSHFDLLDNDNLCNNHIVIEAIIYLAISFYCYSTEVRFVEKKTLSSKRQQQQRNTSTNHHHHHNSQDDNQQDDILQSEHWLSRSLEIAYSFLPSNAPILNQILTVHDRFHSIDKQTIHEDKQVCGYFKVLRSLYKHKQKSTYSSFGSGHNCGTPIMIRVQAPRTSVKQNLCLIGDDLIQQEQYKRLSEQKEAHITTPPVHPTTIDISSFTKNNKIKGLTTRIKILEFNDGMIKTPKENFKYHKQNNKASQNRNHHHNQTLKMASQSTIISDLISIESDQQKKQRIAKIYHSTNRSTINKMRRQKEAPKSTRELDGKALISEDLLFRPHSLDSKNIKQSDKNLTTITSQSIKFSSLGSIKKRRSLSQNGRSNNNNNRQKLSKIVYNGSIKLDGLKLTGKRMNETFQIDNGLLEKLTQAHGSLNNNESLFESNLVRGNIFINNNINLFISKSQQHSKTTRQHSSITAKRHNNQPNPDIGKRLRFVTRRKLSLLNSQDDELNNNDSNL